jgi:TonB family protein
MESLTSSLADFYPADMRRSGIEGAVLVKIRIDTSGCVIARAVIGSSGSDSLDAAALRFVETASYLPAERNGHAVSFDASQPVNFSLSK